MNEFAGHKTGLNTTMSRQTKTKNRIAAFTLVELLVVIAITAILMGLIFGPLTQSFDLTNRARVQVEVQDNVRRLSEIAQIDLTQSMFVFDNTAMSMNFWVRQPDANGFPQGVAVPQPVPFSVIDMVPPARVGDQGVNPLAQVDPTTGQLINRGDIAQPLAPGRTIVRYFIGLRDNTTVPDTSPNPRNGIPENGMPKIPYFNIYDTPNLPGATLAQHNTFILWRAEVAPFTQGGSLDTRFFKLDTLTGKPKLFDSNFWYDNSVAVQPADPSITSNAANGWVDKNGDGAVNISENWRAIARPMVPLDRSDEVAIEKDEDGRPAYFTDPTTTNKYMKITPLVKFEPSYVGNDAGAATYTNDYTFGQPNVPPASHRETYGHWTTPFDLYLYRGGLAGPILNYFYWNGGNTPVQIKTYDTGSSTPTSTNSSFFPGNYDPDKPYFPGPKSPPPVFTSDPNTNVPPILFYVDRKRGMLNFSVPDSIWPGFHDSVTGLATPATASNFNPAAVNSAYCSYIFPGYPSDLTTTSANIGNARPYIDLKAIAGSPLAVLPNIMITPGSEVVTGPDMRPGPNYGNNVVYTAATEEKLDSLGPNEYVIHYRDIPNANLADPDPMNVARQRMGVILFWKQGIRKDDPLTGIAGSPATSVLAPFPVKKADGSPAVRISVRYKMQNNRIDDIVKANYLSRELISFTAGVRLYEFHSGQPQQVTVTQKVFLRNMPR